MHTPDETTSLPMSRRDAIRFAAGTALLASVAQSTTATRVRQPARPAKPFEISLAQWSLHRTLYSGDLDNLDFPLAAREQFGINAIEFVSQFFKDKARDDAYLNQLAGRAEDAGVKCLLIMVDGEGDLGDPDATKRGQAIDNHVQWLEAAARLGCHSIRVNAASSGSFEEQQKLAADGLARLTRLAVGYNLNVLVENHGGFSSHGGWLAGVMRMVDHPRCGTLPDFGNFCMDWSRQDEPDAWYDRYQGVEELMPFAKAVSAKSHEFDDAGNEVRTDFLRMMRIVRDAGYSGYVGIEYEGNVHSEAEGVRLTKQLLEQVSDQLAG